MKRTYRIAKHLLRGLVAGSAAAALTINAFAPSPSWARDVAYEDQELTIRVSPGEPTQVRFPGLIADGFKRKLSAISIEKKDSDLIVFANDKIDETGESIIVRLKDGRSFSLRMQKANAESPRDDVIKISDGRGSIIDSSEEDEPAYKEKRFDYAPPTQVSGLMRELVLAAEFGKNSIPGYQIADQYKGESVINDGAIQGTIDRIFIGTNLWGYVIDAKNLLDQTQKINPATFRLDGTRAISASNWELSPRPLDIEQQIASKHSTKIYIVTKAR